MNFSYVLVTCIPTFEIAIFPEQSLGKTVFGNFPAEGTMDGVWAELIKVCETVWGHLLTHFLTQRQCKSKPETLIRFPPNQNTQRTLYSESVGIFFSFLLKVNSIFLNSTSISYLMFRHKTFVNNIHNEGHCEILKKKRKWGFKSLNPLTNLLIHPPVLGSDECSLCDQGLLCCSLESHFLP